MAVVVEVLAVHFFLPLFAFSYALVAFANLTHARERAYVRITTMTCPHTLPPGLFLPTTSTLYGQHVEYACTKHVLRFARESAARATTPFLHNFAKHATGHARNCAQLCNHLLSRVRVWVRVRVRGARKTPQSALKVRMVMRLKYSSFKVSPQQRALACVEGASHIVHSTHPYYMLVVVRRMWLSYGSRMRCCDGCGLFLLTHLLVRYERTEQNIFIQSCCAWCVRFVG